MESLFKHWLKHWPKSSSPSPAYRRWRRKFLSERLGIAAWAAIAAQVFLLGVSLIFALPLLNASGDPELVVSQADMSEAIVTTLISIVTLGIMLALRRMPHFQRHPAQLILLFPLSILVIPELPYPAPLVKVLDGIDLAIVFWCQAILLPVQWQRHLLSQLLTVVAIFAMSWRPTIASTNLLDVTIDMSLNETFIIGLLVFSLANFGVWFHEQSLQREFDLREQLQHFLQQVSQDLKTPITDSMMLMQQLNQAAKEAPNASGLKLNRQDVQRVLDNGEQQLELLQNLLEPVAASTEATQ